MWIDNKFPNLATEGYTVTSNAANEYNCIAWAVGDTTAWYSHLPGYKWPSAKRDSSAESLVAAFNAMGYETCGNAFLEDEYEKISLYVKSGLWTHVARQLASGRWTSKLGQYEDIEHTTPDALNGSLYGVIHCFMRKKRP